MLSAVLHKNIYIWLQHIIQVQKNGQRTLLKGGRNDVLFMQGKDCSWHNNIYGWFRSMHNYRKKRSLWQMPAVRRYKLFKWGCKKIGADCWKTQGLHLWNCSDRLQRRRLSPALTCQPPFSWWASALEAPRPAFPSNSLDCLRCFFVCCGSAGISV